MDFLRWVRNQWERTAAIVSIVVGLLALLLGWLGVSNEGLPAGQIPYLASGAVLGIFALGAGATLWLSADLRDEWRTLEDIHDELHEINELLASRADVGDPLDRTNGSQQPQGTRRRPLSASRQ